MLFNSYIFLFLFLPITLLGYYALNRVHLYKTANWFIILMSLCFYGYYNIRYLPIICFSILTNYGISKLLNPVETSRKNKMILTMGIVLNLMVLFYFKYFNFFIENVNQCFRLHYTVNKIMLPLGISFYTFQQISYLIDSYRGETQNYSFNEYALFVTYFPQLIAGPIVLHGEMIPQFQNLQNRRFHSENFSRGLYIFSRGLFKKVLIADTFGQAVSIGFAEIATLNSMEAWVVSVSYTFQLFFDFSGYCDMANGLGLMMNIQLPQNFNSPYKATSMVDFWNRWHMTLTRFLTTYVYYPLGGNRRGKCRTYVNIMIVFLVSGIWHGANWTFILWGVLHGICNCLSRACEKTWDKLFVGIRWILTFCTVNLLWVLFRADTIREAGLFIKKMFSFTGGKLRDEIVSCFVLKEISALGKVFSPFRVYQYINIAPFLTLILAFVIIFFAKNSKELKFKPNLLSGILACGFLVWSVYSLTGISVFLYFGF